MAVLFTACSQGTEPPPAAPTTTSPHQRAAACPGPTSASPGARALAAAAYDEGASSLLLFGGQGKPTASAAFEYLGDTWTWTSRGWCERPGPGPSPRFAAAMAYDGGRHVTVMYGGLTASYPSAETWTSDGRSWTLQHPAVSPPPLQDASMAYDAAHGVVVLFGGQSVAPGASPSVLDETWTWDGSTWQQQHPVASPSARVFASMADDVPRGRVILFGGSSGRGQSFDGGLQDTWTWDGATWTRLSPSTSPPLRAEAAMAYDAAHQSVVLFGGVSGRQGTLVNDTWIWDGSRWARGDTAAAPPPREAAAMVYSAEAQAVVLCCGLATSLGTVQGDTWLWDGHAWTART